MRPFIRMSAPALAAAALVLAACGDDAEVSTAPETTTAPATTATTAGGETTTSAARAGDTTTTKAGTQSCQSVPFTPASEDLASSVTATGLSCAEAEAFVEVAGRRTSSGGPQQLTVDGFRCVVTKTLQDPIPQAFYECTNGPKKVTFVRT